ncbi:MAG: permease-like cell division protein FtsX [Salibacteraceae bacterium]
MSSKAEDKFNRKRLRGSYVSVILSISLVLFTLGLQLLGYLYAEKIIKQFKEDIGFTAYLRDDVKEVDVERLMKVIEMAPYTRQARYISKEEALEIMKKDLGEDFMNYLDYNPLLASIEVKVNAEYANTDSLAAIKAELSRSSKIKDISYDEIVIEKVQSKLKLVSIVSLFFVALLLVVAIALINNSIRLAIYSKRFLIKSMLLVGATQSFIRRPFVKKAILHGIYSALIAILLIMAVIYYAEQLFPAIIDFQDMELLAVIFGTILFLGIVISWISTSLAVRKYIRMRSSKLY